MQPKWKINLKIFLIVLGIFVLGAIWMLTYGVYGTQRGFWADKDADTALEAIVLSQRFGDDFDLIGVTGTEDVQIVLINRPEYDSISCVPTFKTTRFFRTYYYYTAIWHSDPREQKITDYRSSRVAGEKDHTLVYSISLYDGTKREVYFESVKATSEIFEYESNGEKVKFQFNYAILEGDYNDHELNPVKVEVKE